ncbi:MAG: nuclear transport factor 2 family protein [Bacteroidota bacterium]
MKNIVNITTLLIALMACTDQNSENTQEQKHTDMETQLTHNDVEVKDEIKKLTETLFNATDARYWPDVIATMADSVYVDYTALGGDAGFKSPQTIVDGWQQLLPGFDRTVHQIHNFAIWVAGERAASTFDGIATHYLNGDQWTVFVGYDTEYIKEGNTWKIARIDLSLYHMNGNNDLPKDAMAVVQNNNAQEFSKTSNAENTVEDFFKALENKDLEALLSTMADEVTQEMPLSPNNFPKVLKNKQELKNQYTGVMEYTQRYERVYFPTQDPNTVIVKYRGIITTQEGKDYNNYYVGIFTTNEQGKLVRFVEQFNPNILLNGWPGLQPETYSMHKAGARTNSGVEMQEIAFNSNGVNLKGHLFLPPNFDSTRNYPASIVTGSWTSVKEQMPDEYASLLAQQGFITLTFDFTGFGESEGQPRQVEDYNLKIADIKAAVDYLSLHKSVDTENLSGLGVCASSGYMAHATAQDARIKKLVLVAPWLHNAEIAKAIYDMRPGGTEGLLASARAAKEQYAETGEMEYVLAASELDPLSAMYVPENAFDYYLNPAKAAGAKYDNRFAVHTWR